MLFPLERAFTRSANASICLGRMQLESYASRERDSYAILRYNRTIMFAFYYKISFYEIDSSKLYNVGIVFLYLKYMR